MFRLWISIIVSLFFITSFLAGCKTSESVSKPSSKTSKEIVEVQTPLVDAKTDDTNSLLWEINGKGMKWPSYLYGTIHLISVKDFFMSDLVKDRFRVSQQLTLEIDMDDPAGLLMAAAGVFMKDGATLQSLLTEEEYSRLDSYFSDSLGMELGMFNRMKPLLVSTMITESTIEGEVTSYETTFMEMASDQDMEILGLETAAFQMSVFDSIPYKQQAKMLIDGLDGKGDTSEEVFEDMVELYKDQNLDELYRLITEESKELGEFDGLLLDTRNINWIPKIEEMAKSKPTFFAVGAAHLPGPLGIINLLREKGYTITPLK